MHSGRATDTKALRRYDSGVTRHRMRQARGPVFVLIAGLGVAPLSTGCLSSDCDRDGGRPQRYSGGNTNAGGSFYESSRIEGPLLYFPSGRTYRLEHGLSEVPVEYSVVVSFTEHPLEGGGVAESAGNQAVVEDINEDYIQVRNDTCADFFMRLTARTAPFETTDESVAADGGS